MFRGEWFTIMTLVITYFQNTLIQKTKQNQANKPNENRQTKGLTFQFPTFPSNILTIITLQRKSGTIQTGQIMGRLSSVIKVNI